MAAQFCLGNIRCDQVRTPFFIPVFDFENMRPKIYDMTDKDLLRDVVVRTTAAPTYFAPPEDRYSDGGLISNNPSALAIAGVHAKLGVSLDKISVLSLDTGGPSLERCHVSSRMTKLGWVRPLITSQLEGNEEVAEFMSSALLGDRHLRISPRIQKKPPIDDPSCVYSYRQVWRTTWSENVDRFLKWRGN